MKKLSLVLFAILAIVCTNSFAGDGNEAEIQIAHNAADPVLETVDIYINGKLRADNISFREATEFLSVWFHCDLVEIAIAPSTSSCVSDSYEFYELAVTDGGRYIVVFSGVLKPGQFAKNPDGQKTALNFFVKSDARVKQRNPGNFDFFAFHGVTDAPAVDVIARGVGTLVDNAAYEGMTDYLRVPVATYTLDVTPAGDNSTILASYVADLGALYYQVAFIMASGFLNPGQNQNGAAFGLYAVLLNGNVVALPLAPVAAVDISAPLGLSKVNAEQNSYLLANPVDFSLQQNYPNPFNPATNISFSLPSSENARLQVFDLTGHQVSSMELGQLSAGQHQIRFDASALPTGKYFYRIQAGSFAATRSMMLVK